MGGGTKISERGITLENFLLNYGRKFIPGSIICEDGGILLIKHLGLGTMVVKIIKETNTPLIPFIRNKNGDLYLTGKKVHEWVQHHGGICLEATQVYNRLKGGINDGG